MNMAKLFAIRKSEKEDGMLKYYTICFRRPDPENDTFELMELYDVMGWGDSEAEISAWKEFDYLIDKDAADIVFIMEMLAAKDYAPNDITLEQKSNLRFVATWFKRAIYDGEMN